MIVKNQKLDEHYEALGFPAARKRKHKLYSEGIAAGTAAGDKVSLHRPVGDVTAPPQLTAR